MAVVRSNRSTSRCAAPVGGRVIVNVSNSFNSLTTENGTAGVASTPSGSSTPFVVTVQRQELDDTAAGVTAPAQAPLAAGTLAFSTAVTTGAAATPADPAQDAAATSTDGALQGSADEPAPVITAEQSPDEPSDGFNLRIPTGPFASRNAGPLGPILASVAGDPTPEVDRDERAMYQDIERRDAEPGYGEGAWRSRLIERNRANQVGRWRPLKAGAVSRSR